MIPIDKFSLVQSFRQSVLSVDFHLGSHQLSSIKQLTLNRISPVSAFIIKQYCPLLTSLTIQQIVQIRQLNALQQLQFLEELDIQLVFENGVELPLFFRQLKRLRVRAWYNSKAILSGAHLHKFKQLQYFEDLDSADEMTIQTLHKIEKLKGVSFNCNKYGPQNTMFTASITPFKNIKVLKIKGNWTLQNKHLTTIALNIPLVEQFALQTHSTKVDNYNFLKGYTSTLKKLTVSGKNFSHYLKQNICTFHPNLQELGVSGDQLYFGGTKSISLGLKSLKTFKIIENTMYFDEQGNYINYFISFKPQLEQLHLLDHYSNKTIKIMYQKLFALKRLKLAGVIEFANSGCFYLAKMNQLQYLHLDCFKMGAGTGVLKIMRNIKEQVYISGDPKCYSNKTKKNMKIMNPWSLIQLNKK